MIDQFSQSTENLLGKTSAAMNVLTGEVTKSEAEIRNQSEVINEIHKATADTGQRLRTLVGEVDNIYFANDDVNGSGFIEKETADMLSERFDSIISDAENQLDACDELREVIVQNRGRLKELQARQEELFSAGLDNEENLTEYRQNEEEIKALTEKNKQAEELERNKRHEAATQKKTSLEYKEKLQGHSDEIVEAGKDTMLNSTIDGVKDVAALGAGLGAGLGLDGLGGLFGGFLGELKNSAKDFLSGMGDLFGGALDGISTLLTQLQEMLNDAVNSATDVYSKYLGRIDSRLNGDSQGLDFETILSDVRAAVGSSLLINQKKLIENIATFVDSGVDYNIEQRALLATLSENLVPTFNALNDNLARMIRIQQADTTLSQMGMTALLQKTLNNTFKDSSFLNQNGMYDSIYGAITDALSTQADTDQMTQFTYAIEKWMGGLYSVGVSTQAITSFTEAINALGTGDLDKLGNDAANTLMAMVANRAGLSYASLLTEGLTADTTNELLKAMVEYLQDIANNTNSNVVKSEWGNILNLEMSDWRAIQNITAEDITSLYNSAVTQQDAETEISNQVQTVLGSRIHLSEMIDNAIDNTMMNFGMSIASNPENYATWKLMNVANSITSQIGGQYLGSITNLLSEGYTFNRFKDEILQIPQDLFSLLSQGDNGIGNLMAGYQFKMQRGGMQQGEGEGISESSTQRSILSYAGLDDLEADDLDILSSVAKNPLVGQIFAEYNNEDEDNELEAAIDKSSELKDKIIQDTEDSIDTVTSAAVSATTDAFDNMERVVNNSADYQATTLQQQSEYVSATAQNIINQETSVIRDINDLYAELFERRSIPIRVALAQVEAQAQGEIRSAIEGITVEISGDEFAALSNMRG